MNTHAPAPPALMIPTGEIAAWEGNPRKRFRADAMEALRESIAEDGIIHPILVRPVATSASGGPAGARYLIVAGERRWRTARDLGLEEVPAAVRDIPDEKALELACFENLTREDLDPEEEASALRSLLGILTWDQVIARTGRSRKTISRRLNLLDAPPDLLEAVAARRISPQVASAVGSLQDPTGKLRAAAAERLLAAPDLTAEQSIALVFREFALRIKNAPFDPADPHLHPDRGSCAGCPHNSSTAREHATEKSACCLDPGCFRAKEGLYAARILEAAAAAGHSVMGDAEAAEAADWASPLVDLAAEIPTGELKPAATAGRRRPYKWGDFAKSKDGSWVVPVSVHLPAGAREAVYYADRREIAEAARSILGRDVFRVRAVSPRAVAAAEGRNIKAADEMDLHAGLNAATRAAAAAPRLLRPARAALFGSMADIADPWTLGFFVARLGSDPAEVAADDDRRDMLLDTYHKSQPLAQDCLFHELLAVLLSALAGNGPLSKSAPYAAFIAASSPSPITNP